MVEHFLKKASDDKKLQEALEAISDFHPGKVWLIGGFVYRTIIHNIYKTESQIKDFDFIVEDGSNIKFPSAWKKYINPYGNPTFVKDDISVDIIPLNNINSIIRRGLSPNISNWLSGTPLTIQSLAWDISVNQIIGNVGIEAIKSRTVGANNYEQLEIYSKIKRVTPQRMIVNKAAELNFKPIFTQQE